jgi:hypothetical protein
MKGETEAYLFEEGAGASTGIEVSGKTVAPVAEASASRAADAAGRTATASSSTAVERVSSYRLEVAGFCAAVRTGAPLRCGPDRAIRSAQACLLAHEAVQQKKRVPVPASIA